MCLKGESLLCTEALAILNEYILIKGFSQELIHFWLQTDLAEEWLIYCCGWAKKLNFSQNGIFL